MTMCNRSVCTGSGKCIVKTLYVLKYCDCDLLVASTCTLTIFFISLCLLWLAQTWGEWKLPPSHQLYGCVSVVLLKFVSQGNDSTLNRHKLEAKDILCSQYLCVFRATVTPVITIGHKHWPVSTHTKRVTNHYISLVSMLIF